jgi:hypothetical protein
MNSDFKDLLRLFGAHSVRYLVVGGYAVSHHAQPRFTKDLDLWIEPDCENASRVDAALREFGIPLIEVTESDFAREGLQFSIGMPPSQLDFLTTVPGLQFTECWPARIPVEIDGISVPYLSKPALIVAKKAAGRAQDLADLEELQRPTADD